MKMICMKNDEHADNVNGDADSNVVDDDEGNGNDDDSVVDDIEDDDNDKC